MTADGIGVSAQRDLPKDSLLFPYGRLLTASGHSAARLAEEKQRKTMQATSSDEAGSGFRRRTGNWQPECSVGLPTAF